ncbi:putative membrane protein [Neorhodopirellula lusitana]|uniref:Membrane protein n=2 Tax=Neorhodopirellula lusitana TaxID=445327 RepID=A0ABY1Q270_9BACT|nr:putative membrane protein [Neorhodopirellula lusitana]
MNQPDLPRPSDAASTARSEASGAVVPDRRNELALIRTDLANERTLLAYVRTSLMMAGTGGTLVKFFGDSKDLLVLGFALIACGAALFLVGLSRCRQQSLRIRNRN